MNESLVPKSSELVSGNVRVITAPTDRLDDDVTLHEIWRVLRKRKWAILGCVVVMVVAAGIISLLLPRRYEAVARVLVNPRDSNALGLDPMDALADSSLGNDIVQQTQVKVLQSDPLAWDVIRQLRLDQRQDFAGKFTTTGGEPIDKISGPRKVELLSIFHDTLRVESIPKTQLIELRFRARDPKVAADVVDALTHAYIERGFRTRYEATMQASDWLSKQLDDLKNNVAASQQRFTEYQQKSGMIGTDESHNIFIVQLDELNKQMAAAEAERILREARYRVAMSRNPELIAEVAPTSTLALLRAQQTDLRNQEAQLTAKYGNAYPRVTQVRTQLAQVESSIDTQIRDIRTRFQSEYEAALNTERMLYAQLEKHKQQAYRMNEAGIQFAILKREFDSSRDLYEGLMKKLKEAGIVAGLRSTNVDIVDPAKVPVSPAEPRTFLNLAVGFLVGTFGGLGLAFLLENLDTTISSPEQAETLVNLPLLGVVPHLSLNGRHGNKPLSEEEKDVPFLLSRPNSQFAEAFRALRTTLLLSSPGAPPKVIVISSAAPGEGKTTLSINCALALAQKGARVLLVDADLRRSCIRGRVRMESTLGLSSCLAGTLDAATAINPLPGAPNLDVLPAGQRPPNPVELLDSDRMRALLENWRKQYDHIVIDTPPLVGLSDALVLSPVADAVLLVARSARTSQQSLRRARDILAKVNARTVGVIINDLNVNSSDYYSYYGYYGSKYGEYYAGDAKN
ncbi:MAG: GumC family protein [Terriglobales bacterium]